MIGEQNATNLIRLGTDFTLMCPFENFDQLKWFKNSIDLQSSQLNINLENISLADEGMKHDQHQMISYLYRTFNREKILIFRKLYMFCDK